MAFDSKIERLYWGLIKVLFSDTQLQKYGEPFTVDHCTTRCYHINSLKLRYQKIFSWEIDKNIWVLILHISILSEVVSRICCSLCFVLTGDQWSCLALNQINDTRILIDYQCMECIKQTKRVLIYSSMCSSRHQNWIIGKYFSL